MYKRMLRAVVATAFSAALACGVLAVGGDAGQVTTPAGSQAAGAGDIAWAAKAGDIAWGAAAGDIAWNSGAGDIAWGPAPKDIAWGEPAGTVA
ncbi:5'-nucleotidase [Streptomyces liangshanensis]|uniref:5'-nucleotidase n=1 Tax=Streptomyces liangshanensis TaxID=2717324 RepID=A0A6G9GZT9_9ACTN|nr:5'-nucleotidase [Streptomyces liangshanensis]